MGEHFNVHVPEETQVWCCIQSIDAVRDDNVNKETKYDKNARKSTILGKITVTQKSPTLLNIVSCQQKNGNRRYEETR